MRLPSGEGVSMKSIKPGRGPSAMGALGSVIAIVAGVFWTIAAFSMGAPAFFPLFGVLFVIVGIVQAVYNFRNATSKDRYSVYDITDADEEMDPLQRRFGGMGAGEGKFTCLGKDGVTHFCPYCGTEAEEGYAFCKKCGRKLP